MPCQIFGQHTSGPGMVSEPMDEHVSYENFFPQMVKFTKDFLGKVPNQMGLLANFLKNDFVSVEFRDFLWGGGVWIHLLAKNCPCGRNGMLQVKWFSVTTYGMSKKKGPYFSTLLGTDPRDDCPLPEQGSGLAPLEGDLQVASPPGAKHDSGWIGWRDSRLCDQWTGRGVPTAVGKGGGGGAFWIDLKRTKHPKNSRSVGHHFVDDFGSWRCWIKDLKLRKYEQRLMLFWWLPGFLKSQPPNHLIGSPPVAGHEARGEVWRSCWWDEHNHDSTGQGRHSYIHELWGLPWCCNPIKVFSGFWFTLRFLILTWILGS